MTLNDLGEMQRYLVDEEAEHWREGSISRREFIRRVTLLVGGAAAATGVLAALGCDPASPEPANSTASVVGTSTVAASPAASAPAGGSSKSPYHVEENDPAIHTESVQFPSSTQTDLKLMGYLAYNVVKLTPGKPGAVLVQHENRGLTDYIKDVVRRLAKVGYVAMCVDLVSRAGGSAAHPDEGERTGILGQLSTDLLISDLLDGVKYLQSRPEADPTKLGAIGFCFGGGMTWRLITKSPAIKAAVPFYGPNPPLADVSQIKAAVLGIYGEQDSRITGQEPDLEKALKAANITHEMKIYAGANHAFHNDTGANYNAEAASDAWDRTLRWLADHL